MKFLDKLKGLFKKEPVSEPVVQSEPAAQEPSKPTRRELSMAEKVFWHRVDNATSTRELIRLGQKAELLPIANVCWDVPRIEIVGKGQFQSGGTVRKQLIKLRRRLVKDMRSHLYNLGGRW